MSARKSVHGRRVKDDRELLARVSELLALIRQGRVTSLAWCAITARGDCTVAATGDLNQLVDAVEELRDTIHNAAEPTDLDC